MALPMVSMTGDAFTRAQVNGLSAVKRFGASAGAASVKLATQERIISPGEDVLAFSTSRKLRSEISGLNAVIQSSQANATALGIGVDGLETIKSQLDSIKVSLLQSQSANNDLRAQIQTQIDSAVALIDSTASSTRFGGRSLLDGGTKIKSVLSINVAGVVTNFAFDANGESLTNTAAIQGVKVNKLGAGLPTKTLTDGRTVLSLTVSVASTNKATKGAMVFTAGAAAGFAEFRVTGKLGSATIRIDSTAASLGHMTAVATAFNSQASETGVALSSDGAGLKLTAVGFGDDDFVKVELLSASAANTAAFGGVSSAEAVGTSETKISKAAIATINGVDVRMGGEFGKTARYTAFGYDLEIDFGTGGLANAQAAITTKVNIVLDQGISGVVGTSGVTTEVVQYGFGNFTTASLGRAGNGLWAMTEGSSGDAGSNTKALGNLILANASVAELAAGGRNDINSGNVVDAVQSINRAIDQVIAEQSKLGTLLSTFNNAVGRAQQVVGNLTSADADVIGVDAAQEISTLIQGQMGVQSASAVLSQSNAIQASIFNMLR